jgi:hypothetical protein
MGTYSKGILGPFSGKVGTVVGSNWKGIDYMRSYRKRIKNPRTQSQMMQRTKLSMASKFAKPIKEVLNSGWRLYAKDKTPVNAAVKYLISNAIIGVYPDYAIDPEKVLISSGSLATAVNPSVSVSGCEITVGWDDNCMTGNAATTDRVLVAVISPERAEAVIQDGAADRSELCTTVIVPAHWSGDTVCCYLGFINKFKDSVANSVYLGELTIT